MLDVFLFVCCSCFLSGSFLPFRCYCSFFLLVLIVLFCNYVTHHTTLRVISFDGALGVAVEFDSAAEGLGVHFMAFFSFWEFNI